VKRMGVYVYGTEYRLRRIQSYTDRIKQGVSFCPDESSVGHDPRRETLGSRFFVDIVLLQFAVEGASGDIKDL